MDKDVLTDENVGWPSYVDFLASFAFVLILFVTWSVTLVIGREHAISIQQKLTHIKQEFDKSGFESSIEGEKLRIPLKNKVVFALSKWDLDSPSKTHLREAGKLIGQHQEVARIIVMGYADRVQPKNDAFFNWQVSVARAQTVLRYLYECQDCGYDPELVRSKLVLRGEGDLSGQQLKSYESQNGIAGDRRVDIVLDFGNYEVH